MDAKGKYLMEVRQDSIYFTVSDMPDKVGFVMQLSEDSLVLKNSLDAMLAFRLDKLTESTLEVGKGESKLVFHKKK